MNSEVMSSLLLNKYVFSSFLNCSLSSKCCRTWWGNEFQSCSPGTENVKKVGVHDPLPPSSYNGATPRGGGRGVLSYFHMHLSTVDFLLWHFQRSIKSIVSTVIRYSSFKLNSHIHIAVGSSRVCLDSWSQVSPQTTTLLWRISKQC